MSKVVLIGESWFSHTIHQKGFDSFTSSEYTEGGSEFCTELAGHGHDVTRIPAHYIPERVPDEVSGYDDVDVVVISDVGANSFLLTPKTFVRSERTPDKLQALAEWVRGGGGLLMVGGYMSFTGIDAKARFGQSALADVLPVKMLDTDDRVERPDGVEATTDGHHASIDGLATSWPPLLGYNRVVAREGATTVATCGDDPLLVVGSAGAGRTAAFTSDLAPHWAPPEFLAWDGYGRLWHQLVTWLAG